MLCPALCVSEVRGSQSYILKEKVLCLMSAVI
jgi:hypothetical protein